MAFELKPTDQEKLTATVSSVLDAYSSGEVSRAQAEYFLCHLIELAGRGNEAEVRDWLRPDRVRDWKKDCASANGS